MADGDGEIGNIVQSILGTALPQEIYSEGKARAVSVLTRLFVLIL